MANELVPITQERSWFGAAGNAPRFGFEVFSRKGLHLRSQTTSLGQDLPCI